jgi:hypothetical protein
MTKNERKITCDMCGDRVPRSETVLGCSSSHPEGLPFCHDCARAFEHRLAAGTCTGWHVLSPASTVGWDSATTIH